MIRSQIQKHSTNTSTVYKYNNEKLNTKNPSNDTKIEVVDNNQDSQKEKEIYNQSRDI